VSFQGNTHHQIPPVSTVRTPSAARQNTYACLGPNQVSRFDYQHVHRLTFAFRSAVAAKDQRPKGLEDTISWWNAAIETLHLAGCNTNTCPLPPTAYLRYQGVILNEMKKRGVRGEVVHVPRWIISRPRYEDIQIKIAFWQLAEIGGAEDRGRIAGDKATMKRARGKRGGTNNVLDPCSRVQQIPKLADWLASSPPDCDDPFSLAQELEKQMQGEAARSSAPRLEPPPWSRGGTPESESDDDVNVFSKSI